MGTNPLQSLVGRHRHKFETAEANGIPLANFDVDQLRALAIELAEKCHLSIPGKPLAGPNDLLATGLLNTRKRELGKRALRAWGDQSQMMMIVEESSELNKAIAKTGRIGRQESAKKIVEEAADLETVLICVRLIFGDEKVNSVMSKKLDRLEGLIELAEKRASDGSA